MVKHNRPRFATSLRFGAFYYPMADIKRYRDESRKHYGTSDEYLTIDQLNAGSLQRIADATEAMAKNHVQLQNDYNYMKISRDGYRELYEMERKRTKALKGVITKLKKAGEQKGQHHG